MAFEIPVDLINQVQILLRKEANVSSYDPDDPLLPNLSSLEEAIAELDPSPPYLRCKYCRGRLLRGVQSVICVFCGRDLSTDVHPEPINFRNTVGCSWLLESLDLDGSEMAGPSIDATKSKRGQLLNEFPLSDLLDLEIRWPSESEKVGTSLSNETHVQSKGLLNLAGVDIDNFFSEVKTGISSLSSVEPSTLNQQLDSTASNTSHDHGNLNLFGSVQPYENTLISAENEGGDSFSGWEANFQTASSATMDPFAGSADVSVHIDTVFRPPKESISGKAEDDKALSSSAKDDWFQVDLWSNPTSGQPKQVEITANASDGGTTEKALSSTVDWDQGDQWEPMSKETPLNKIADDDDDGFDGWNDFTSSSDMLNPSNSYGKQNVDNLVPLAKETSDIDFSSLAPASKDVGYASSSDSDMLAGAFPNPNGSVEVKMMQSDASASDRMRRGNTKGEFSEEVTKGLDVSSARSDFDELMSQMHDLSFMLEDNLSIPPK